MASKLYWQKNKMSYGIQKFVCDDVEDLKKLNPTGIGCSAFVIHTKDTYMLDSKRVWYCITSENDPVECDCVEELTIWDTIKPTSAE